jgi:GMP synthase (glutamine-hydrolysing)
LAKEDSNLKLDAKPQYFLSQKMQAKYDTILILDFGGQYCHLIGRRIREHGVYSEIVPHDISPEEITALNKKFNVKGLIFSGGPSSVYEPNAPRLHPRILEANLPILGLCYGHQLLAQLTGSKVKPAICKESTNPPAYSKG